VNPGHQLKEIDRPDDPHLAMVYELMSATLADPNIVLGLDRMQEFLLANRANGPRRFCVLAAIPAETPGVVTGATIFSYVASSNCGFSEYIVAAKEARGAGVGRLLFDGRKAVLDAEARQRGAGRCRGLFIEVEHPDRTPAEFVAAEQESALDPWERWRLFDHLGFWRVDVPYVQPPLAEGKAAVDYLDLMFAPWQASIRAARRLPTAWVLETLEPILASWAPLTYRPHYARLAARLAHPDVALLPLFPK
jgi:GNAT superfamily N-acetyltransferase